jgi:energy-coupling factor transporter ATP-binding protein EcfA2
MANIYRQILEWSETRPMWLRDALRRLIEKNELSEADKQELMKICLQEAGCEHGEDLVTPIPLAETHIPNGQDATSAVNLRGISEVNGINKIQEGASVEFNPSGLTLIYGDNGAGKSGYIRILKKVCRSRGSDGTIHPNVYSAEVVEQSAVVGYSNGEAADNHTWTPASIAPATLSAVSVFDSQSAVFQVSQVNELAYQPLGLDLLSRAANVGSEIGDRIRALITQEERRQEDFNDFTRDTKTWKKLQTIDGVEVEKLPEEFPFSEKDAEQLETMRRQIAELKAADPTKEAQKLRAQVIRIRSLGTHLSRLDTLFSGAFINSCGDAAMAVKTTHEAVQLAAREFETAPVSGTGSNAWKQLWDSARRFYAEAYPGKEFPIDDDVLCVLCQQPLGADAVARMGTFQTFVTADIQQQYDAAVRAVDILRNRANVEITSEHIDSLIEELKTLDPKLAEEAQLMLKQLSLRKKTTESLLTKNCSLLQLQDVDNSSVEKIETTVIQQLNEKAEQHEKHARDQKSIEPLEKEAVELQEKQKAASAIARIEQEIKRKKRLVSLRGAEAISNTTATSRKADQLSEALTEEIVEKFRTEVKELNAGGDLAIQLESAGTRRAVPRHRITLSTTRADIPIREVLSEGEFRAIAIAGFMTEIGLSPKGSGIIFDDPVSSLDHKRKYAIAERIFKEAHTRQVVVFSHDLPFVLDLIELAEKEGEDAPELTLKTIYPAMGDAGSGRSFDGLPWEGLTAEQQIGTLNKTVQEEAIPAHKAGDNPKYNHIAKGLYRDLRDAWESAIERVLFGDVVRRFAREVRTRNLTAIQVTEDDCTLVAESMGKCNKYAHSRAAEEGTIVYPEPAEIQADIKTLKDWIAVVKAR